MVLRKENIDNLARSLFVDSFLIVMRKEDIDNLAGPLFLWLAF